VTVVARDGIDAAIDVGRIGGLDTDHVPIWQERHGGEASVIADDQVMAGGSVEMVHPISADQHIISVLTVDGVIAPVGTQLALDFGGALQPAGAVIDGGECAIIAQNDVVSLIAVNRVAGNAAHENIIALIAFDVVDTTRASRSENVGCLNLDDASQ